MYIYWEMLVIVNIYLIYDDSIFFYFIVIFFYGNNSIIYFFCLMLKLDNIFNIMF